ncbi:DNA topoisomerase [Escherichia coli]|uniref:DNA topoisomerase n=1 Tax=Escherichia coli TaxID=562 RepID=UPI00388FA05F
MWSISKSLRKISPKAYSLGGITSVASSKFGCSGEQVLAICQSLYETHKLTSYPRSDSSYLPESQLADAPQILALRVTYPGIAANR